MKTDQDPTLATAPRRLPKAQRRRRLLDMALQIIREEGADRLTLGHLASREGVSKPVVYDHFGTRSGLLIELYRSMDAEHTAALRDALAERERTLEETVDLLAAAYVHCSADTGGEWQALGSALTGSEEMGAVYLELLDDYVRLFAAALTPHVVMSPAELERQCLGLVAAGEALSTAMLRSRCSEAEAAQSLGSLMLGVLRQA